MSSFVQACHGNEKSDLLILNLLIASENKIGKREASPIVILTVNKPLVLSCVLLRFNCVTIPKKRNLIILLVAALIIAIVLSSFVYLNYQPSINGKQNVSLSIFPNELDNAHLYRPRSTFFR